MKDLLPTEGIPDHHEAFRSREALTAGLGAKAHPPTRVPRPKAEEHGDGAALSKAREAEGETSERDRDVRGSIASAPWDENAHAHDQAVRLSS